MRCKCFDLVAAGVFGFVSLMHLVRILLGWGVQVGPEEIPFWISWVGFIGAGLLSVWGFASASKAGR